MELKPEFRRKSIRSFVLRAGRLTEGQRRAFETFWPEYRLSLEQGVIDLTKVFQRDAPRVLEIGFGMGDSLLQMLQAEPDKDFIGIEVYSPGVGRLTSEAGKLALTNLRIYHADAVDVLKECIPPQSLDRVQLYFPDPWHKKKHHKRRIVQPEFVQLIYSRLKPGALFHLATDWGPYAEQMLELLDAAEGLDNTAGKGSYAERPDFRPDTKFENRGTRLGHDVWDLLYRSTNARVDK